MTVQDTLSSTPNLVLDKHRTPKFRVTSNRSSAKNAENANAITSHIDQSAVGSIIEILTTLYKDPEMAVVREYVSNAVDSHLKSGQDKKVIVTLPGKRSNEFVVQDFGLGMDKETMLRSFAGYGYSSKKDDLDQKGFNGLGSKSAWMIANNFSVIAVHDGVERTMIGIKREDSSHDFRIISEVPTASGNGVTVRIPVNRTRDFENYARSALYGFEADRLEIIQDGAPYEMSFYDEVEFQHGIFYFKTSERTVARPSININVGGEIYSISDLIMGETEFFDWSSTLLNAPIYRFISQITVKMPIGSVDITPARDNFQRTAKTVENIKILLAPLMDRPEPQDRTYFNPLPDVTDDQNDGEGARAVHPLNIAFAEVFEEEPSPKRDSLIKFIMEKYFHGKPKNYVNQAGEIWSNTLLALNPITQMPLNRDSKMWLWTSPANSYGNGTLVRRNIYGAKTRNVFLDNTKNIQRKTVYVVGTPDKVLVRDITKRVLGLPSGALQVLGSKILDYMGDNIDAIAPAGYKGMSQTSLDLFYSMYQVTRKALPSDESGESEVLVWTKQSQPSIVVLSDGFSDEVRDRQANLIRKENTIILTWDEFVALTAQEFAKEPVANTSKLGASIKRGGKSIPSREYAVFYPDATPHEYVDNESKKHTVHGTLTAKMVSSLDLPKSAVYSHDYDRDTISTFIDNANAKVVEEYYYRSPQEQTVTKLFALGKLDRPLVLIPSNNILSVFTKIIEGVHNVEFGDTYTELRDERLKDDKEKWGAYSIEDRVLYESLAEMEHIDFYHAGVYTYRLPDISAFMRSTVKISLPESFSKYVDLMDPKCEKYAAYEMYINLRNKTQGRGRITVPRELIDNVTGKILASDILRPMQKIANGWSTMNDLDTFAGSPLEESFRQHIATIIENAAMKLAAQLAEGSDLDD